MIENRKKGKMNFFVAWPNWGDSLSQFVSAFPTARVQFLEGIEHPGL
jgi:hypothetical protein